MGKKTGRGGRGGRGGHGGGDSVRGSEEGVPKSTSVLESGASGSSPLSLYSSEGNAGRGRGGRGVGRGGRGGRGGGDTARGSEEGIPKSYEVKELQTSDFESGAAGGSPVSSYSSEGNVGRGRGGRGGGRGGRGGRGGGDTARGSEEGIPKSYEVKELQTSDFESGATGGSPVSSYSSEGNVGRGRGGRGGGRGGRGGRGGGDTARGSEEGIPKSYEVKELQTSDFESGATGGSPVSSYSSEGNVGRGRGGRGGGRGVRGGRGGGDTARGSEEGIPKSYEVKELQTSDFESGAAGGSPVSSYSSEGNVGRGRGGRGGGRGGRGGRGGGDTARGSEEGIPKSYEVKELRTSDFESGATVGSPVSSYSSEGNVGRGRGGRGGGRGSRGGLGGGDTARGSEEGIPKSYEVKELQTSDFESGAAGGSPVSSYSSEGNVGRGRGGRGGGRGSRGGLGGGDTARASEAGVLKSHDVTVLRTSGLESGPSDGSMPSVLSTGDDIGRGLGSLISRGGRGGHGGGDTAAGVSTEIAKISSSLSAIGIDLPKRQHKHEGGSAGRKIYVETNHLPLVLKCKVAYHYDVNINPDKPKRLLRYAMEEYRRIHYPDRYPAFDGRKNLISSQQLPVQNGIPDTVSVCDEDSRRARTFEITLNFVSQVDLSTLENYMDSGTSLVTPQKAIQAIDIILRNAPAMQFVPVGRSFFSQPGRIVSLGDGLDMWLGLFQSVNLGWRPFVNVDVVHKGFHSPRNVIEIIMDLLDNRYQRLDISRELNGYQKEVVRKYIKGLKVDYVIPNQPNTKRRYRVNDVTIPAAKLEFTLEQGPRISVQKYFAQEKNYPLKYPQMPCLHVGSLQREKPIYLPVELCSIVQGQPLFKKMNEMQTSSLIKAAATNTEDRKRKIMDMIQKVNFNGSRCVQEFGLSVSERFERVSARILDPPRIEYKECQPMPQRGVWSGGRFCSGQHLSKWAILNLSTVSSSEITNLERLLKECGLKMGMTFEPCSSVETKKLPDGRHPNSLMKSLQYLSQYFLQNKDLQLIIVIVFAKGDTYHQVKQAAELTVGVLTQCIRSNTMTRLSPSTVSNILLKINSKLNGVNHRLAFRPACLNNPVMLIGADVTHPPPDQTDVPSIAAVCASHDPNCFSYNIKYRLQPARQEIITDLKTIMREQLLFFNQKTRYQPSRLFFFRDGVSEGDFEKVLKEELSAIRQACQSLHPDYKPPVTFVVVQKRHHTRFFPTRRQDCEGKNSNVPAGTVVDTVITHPTERDFYLVSHASIQGVSRPTKYYCLWDENSMSEDDLQQLTYYLCHMFSRCTRSVSYPAPTYYAHLAASRASVYLKGKNVNLQNLEEEQRRASLEEQFMKNSPMFFV